MSKIKDILKGTFPLFALALFLHVRGLCFLVFNGGEEYIYFIPSLVTVGLACVVSFVIDVERLTKTGMFAEDKSDD